jgi:hypothetical protein
MLDYDIMNAFFGTKIYIFWELKDQWCHEKKNYCYFGLYTCENILLVFRQGHTSFIELKVKDNLVPVLN